MPQHGLWLYACGHEAYTCKCPEHSAERPLYRSDLCPSCRAKLTPSPTPTDAFTLPREATREPFPKATD